MKSEVGAWPTDQIPCGWEWALFSDVFDNVTSNDLKLKQKDYADIGALPVVDQGQELVGGYTDREELTHPSELPVVLFGDHTHCVKYLDFSFVQGADGTKVLKPTACVAPRFAYWAMRTIELPKKGYSRHYKFLRDSEFPIPPLAEQQRIAAKIEALQERSRKAREALSEVGPLLEQFRQSLLSAAFRGDLTADWRATHPDVEPATELFKRIRQERRLKWERDELDEYAARGKQPPKGWRDKYTEPEPINGGESAILPELPDGWGWASADELTAIGRPIVYGIIKPGPDTPGGVPYVRITEMKDRKVHVNDLRRCNPEREGQFKRARIRSGDILISKDGATYGMVAIVPDEADGANITQHVMRYSLFPDVNNEFIAYVIESPACQKWIDGQIKGMAMPGINVGDFRRMPIPVPPSVEQLEIKRRIEEMVTSIRATEALLKASECDLTQLDQSILAKAFRGELVPQDPNDEPASVLLKRIRQQRNAQAAETNGKPKHRIQGREA